MSTQQHRPSRPPRPRFVDPEQLICPGCGDRVRPEPPGYWRVADGLPAPGFSHRDGSALCRSRDGVVAEPVEVDLFAGTTTPSAQGA